ncbi:uncharacterized protein LOC130294607 isoform X3 [Hyla sarda]|nr:uncharacterized protein LOC130294607 isoform X3 [Hyla sarda]XP_056400704.1 uncharacterized protein LOC130294607 isoform X3 [Hyla sarda]XP_056400705.1 uncharacterized protein LOC130294607 isoform X3 [Hyla sarda]XP_056400706.1 uncharacterized protein LOC130294607 isoform X3 [Hyla sarda]XP_056400707.1 uncharacterized protein LOC130294607 isoform X3 [Hyla sarda]
MKITVAALYDVSTFIYTASCLRCMICHWTLNRASDDLGPVQDIKASFYGFVNGQPFCLGSNYSCASEGHVCSFMYLSMTKYDQSQEVFIKRDCLHPSECNVSGSFTTPLQKTSYATTCCATDKCTPTFPNVRPENNTENGVLCPSCFSSTKEECVAKYSMACTGEEKSCLAFKHTALFDSNFVNTMGCASEHVCKGKGDLSHLKKPGMLAEITCNNVNNDVQLKKGHFLWCQFCLDYNINNCTDLAHMCLPEEDVCVFERTKSVYDGRIEVEIIKRCGKSHECSRAGSIRSSTKTIFVNTTCCNHNVCQMPLPTLPSDTSDENGLTCPACFVPNSDRCLGRSNLKCTGKENRCIHYMRTETQDISTVTESLHGCTTDEICEAGSGMSYARGHYHKTIKTDVMCSRAGGWRAPLCTILLSMAITFIVLTLVISL